MRLWELADGVFACVQPDRGLGWSNSGLVARGGGLVVDTFWDLPRTRELLACYARVHRGLPRRVVNTHHNGDHCWGNQLLPGAEIIAHRACAEAWGREQPAFLQLLKDQPGDSDPVLAWLVRELEPWDFRDIEPTPPTRVFDRELRLDLEGTEVILIHVGPAHTAGDVIVYLPRERVVFAGDVVLNRCTPIAWEGSFERWIAALDFIAALAPRVVVPGHGPPGDPSMVGEMKGYLEYVRGEGTKWLRHGCSVVEAAARIERGPYRQWTQPERVVTHLMRLDRELRGEDPSAPLDVQEVLRAMFFVRRMREEGQPSSEP